MGPLGFVNWHAVNVRFRLLMWMLAFVLAIVVLVHVMPSSAGNSPRQYSPAVAGAQAFHHTRTSTPWP